jgi:hypothetical protein
MRGCNMSSGRAKATPCKKLYDSIRKDVPLLIKRAGARRRCGGYS